MQCGYSNLTVLDVSKAALSLGKRRLGRASEQIQWLVADICEADLPVGHYDLWHDRAVFHFLTLLDQRASYAAKAAKSVKRNGYLIVCTFGPEGPTRCSGLDTTRYDAAALAAEFSSHFLLKESRIDWHTAPSGEQQQFLCAVFQRDHHPAQAE
jgi:SAM-dependent methyltransferase